MNTIRKNKHALKTEWFINIYKNANMHTHLMADTIQCHRVIPDMVGFYITILDSHNSQLYNELAIKLQELKYRDDIIVEFDFPKSTQQPTNVKPNCVDKLNETQLKNTELQNKYNYLIKELALIGCDVKNISEPKYDPITNFYEYVEHVDYAVQFKVFCKKNTDFFNFMMSHVLYK